MGFLHSQIEILDVETRVSSIEIANNKHAEWPADMCSISASKPVSEEMALLTLNTPQK